MMVEQVELAGPRPAFTGPPRPSCTASVLAGPGLLCSGSAPHPAVMSRSGALAHPAPCRDHCTVQLALRGCRWRAGWCAGHLMVVGLRLSGSRYGLPSATRIPVTAYCLPGAAHPGHGAGPELRLPLFEASRPQHRDLAGFRGGPLGPPGQTRYSLCGACNMPSAYPMILSLVPIRERAMSAPGGRASCRSLMLFTIPAMRASIRGPDLFPFIDSPGQQHPRVAVHSQCRISIPKAPLAL